MSAIREASVYVTAVRIDYAGSTLVGDHASGVSELVVDDAFEFNEGGGLLSVNGDVLTYTRWDDDTNTITLASPTSSAYDDNDRVLVSPLAPVKVADVVDIEGASYEAVVWHTLSAMLPETIFGPDEQPTGTIFYTGDHDKVWLVNCPGRTPAIDPAALPSDGGDLDPDEDVYFIDGPPDFYVGAPGFPPYLDYAAMEAATDSTWAAAVGGIVAAAGTITVSGNTITTGTRYYPVWVVPTNGKQCRIAMDTLSASGDPGGPAETMTFYADAQSSTLDDAGGTRFDDFEYGFEFSSAPDGMFSRLWFAYSDANSAYEGSLPAGAVGWTTPDQFQTQPLVSLTPAEADAISPLSDPAAPFVVVMLRYPIARWGFSGSSTDNALTVTGLRVVRT